MNTNQPQDNSESSFRGLGIAPRILEILTQLKYTVPTPIQIQSIPYAIEGKDVMGIAQTGTGKTLAFGIPMIQRLAQLKGSRGLVVLPTRELALQVDQALQQLGRSLNLRTSVLIGGEPIGRQMQSLRKMPNIIVCTPGRLIDHLEQKSVKLDNVAILILDEADHMLDMGFAPQIKKILQAVPKQRQTMLFSATMPAEIVGIASSYMALPVRVEVARPGTASEQVTQELFFVERSDKLNLLQTLLQESRGSILVFTRTKFTAKKITQVLRKNGNLAAEIHSNRSLAQRREALEGFKVGKYRVLVATDIAARGIDVSDIELVINYDIPENPEDYVHRIGRTGRAGSFGKAVSFATPDQRSDIRDIERLIKKAIPVTKGKTISKFAAPEPMERERRFERPRNLGRRDSGRRDAGRPGSGGRAPETRDRNPRIAPGPRNFTPRPRQRPSRPGQRPGQRDRRPAPAPRKDARAPQDQPFRSWRDQF